MSRAFMIIMAEMSRDEQKRYHRNGEMVTDFMKKNITVIVDKEDWDVFQSDHPIFSEGFYPQHEHEQGTRKWLKQEVSSNRSVR